MDISDIHFHDCQLRRVIELCSTNDLLMEVNYPVDWENNHFEPRTIVFRDVLNYRVDEGPFLGAATILDVQDLGLVGSRRNLRIETNAGARTLLCANVEVQ